MNQPRDKGLNGNEKIEQAVAALQQEPTQEQLAQYPEHQRANLVMLNTSMSKP